METKSYLPPAEQDLEHTLIFELARFPKRYKKEIESMEVDDFYTNKSKLLFNKIKKGDSIEVRDSNNLTAELKNVSYLVEIVKDRSNKRKIIAICRKFIEMAYENIEDAVDIIKKMQIELSEL